MKPVGLFVCLIFSDELVSGLSSTITFLFNQLASGECEAEGIKRC